jgi:gluconokinase
LNQPLILAIDIGTSSVRAGLYDVNGNLLRRTLVKNERSLKSTPDGGAEIDADEAFAQLVSAIDAVLDKSRNSRSEIVAVASCSFWHSLMGIDAKSKPTTKVLGWADNRSREYVATLRKRLDEDEIHNRTGARFHSSFWPAKLLWFQNEQPSVFARTEKWLSLSDYLSLKLSGRISTSVSMASATGIFDIRKSQWDRALAHSLKIRTDGLPKVTETGGTFSISSKFAKRWPRLARAKWLDAIGDGAANNVGTGCVTNSRAAVMIGTSGAMRVAFPGDPPSKIPPGLWCYRIDRDRIIAGGALSDGGGLYQWLRDNLRIDKSIDVEIAKRQPGGHGLTFLPFIAGERSTGYHEFAKGAVLGLTTNTDAVDIVHAAMESVAYRFAEIFDQLNKVAKITEIVASGGALRESPAWTQILADVLGRKITLAEAREASMRGAVLLALESLGNIERIEGNLETNGRTFAPNPKAHLIYKEARERHRRFYDLIIQKPINHGYSNATDANYRHRH